MTSHWPTFADGLFWCACDNRTFATQDEWQLHVADEVMLERGLCSVLDTRAKFTPTHVAVEQPHRGS